MKAKTQKTFLVRYSFAGSGEVKIKAKDEDEAIKKWNDGDYKDNSEVEFGQDYEFFDTIEL